MLPVTQSSSQESTPPYPSRQRIAPLWHTAVVMFILLTGSLAGSRGVHPLAGRSHLPLYLWTMSWEWALTGFVYLGIRKRMRLRELVGGRWKSLEDVLRDFVIAGGFWLLVAMVLGGISTLMHLDRGGSLEDMRRQIDFLVPGTNVELIAWFLVSATAGMCEEIIFRGYLQLQFAAFLQSLPAGIILSAVVFGAAHGYEGRARMFLLVVFGLMLGLLAWWRKSLRPGMIAHAWQDILSGAVMRLLK